MEKKQIEEMIDLAIEQLQYSYVPYSHFHVGAALLAKNGLYYTGCNIENAAYTPTNCAERTAFFKAISEGVREFDAICIVGGKDGVLTEYAAPCGVCRQVMMEFCDPKTFKRSCLPDGPKVGTVAVSPRGDLRMSSDSCVRIWMDRVEKLS